MDVWEGFFWGGCSTYHSVHMEVRGHLLGVRLFSFHCVEPGDQTLSSGSVRQAPFPLSHHPGPVLLILCMLSAHSMNVILLKHADTFWILWSGDEFLFAVGNTLGKSGELRLCMSPWCLGGEWEVFFKTCPWGRYGSTSWEPHCTLSREDRVQEEWTT